MDKIMLSSADIEFILNWRDEHKDLVRLGVSPLRAVKIICFETGYTITAIREDINLSLGVNHNGNSLGKLVFEILDNGMCHLIKDTTKLDEENRQAVLTVYASTMALLVFGSETTRRKSVQARSVAQSVESCTPKKKKTKKRKNKGFVYILHTNDNEPRLTIRGSHRSPNGMFSVRGHYRHYKNGRIVWISEYTKGRGKKKDKTYKVGLNKEA